MKRTNQKRDVRDAPVGYVDLLRRNRDFRLLWLGQVVSQLGDWFDTIAVLTIVQHLTGSGRAVGLIFVTRFLPSVFISPLSGVVADRLNRRQIMIASDLVRAVVVLGFLLVRRPEQVWIIYALTVLQLTFSTFFEPAKSAAIPSVVPPREIVAANAITSVTWSAMLTLGAAAGGFVTGWVGTDAAFVIDSLTYLASAALIARLTLPKRTPRPKQKLTIAKALGVTDMLEGIAYVRQRPRLIAYLAVKPAWGIGGGIMTLLAVFGEKVFPVGASAALGIGALYTARGVGTAVGPVLTRRFGGETRRAMQVSIGFGFVVAGAFYFAFGVAPTLAVALVVLAVAHAGGSVLWVSSTALLQLSVEDQFRGRVFAAELALMTLAMAAANYLTGYLLDPVGYSPRTVAAWTGVFFTLPGLVWFITSRWWDKGRGEDTRVSVPRPEELTVESRIAEQVHLTAE
ncbi:MAG: MFS transporter [Pyrinomonadaceae bacterium]